MVSDIGDPGALPGWGIEGCRRRVLGLKLVMEDAPRVCPRGLPMLLAVGEPVDTEEARATRVLGCLDMLLEAASAAVLVEILYLSPAMGGLLTAFVPSRLAAPVATLLLVGRGGGLMLPSLLDGRGGGRIDPSPLGGLIELDIVVLPYMDVGRALMLGFLLRVLSVTLLGAVILELGGLIRVGDVLSPPPLEFELNATALLSRGAGAAAAALVSMLNPLCILPSFPLPKPLSTAGFLMDLVREGNDVVDMALW